MESRGKRGPSVSYAASKSRPRTQPKIKDITSEIFSPSTKDQLFNESLDFDEDVEDGERVFNPNAGCVRAGIGPIFRTLNKETNEIVFAGHLKKIQCKFRKKGKRCKNASVYTIPYCEKHLKMYRMLERKRSTVPGIGFGLFAARDIEPKTRIGIYWGEVISAEEDKMRYGADGTSPYTVNITGTDLYFDATYYRCYLSNINHKPQSEANCIFSTVKIKDRLYPIVVTKDKMIHAGEELFLFYSQNHLIVSDKYDYGEEKLGRDEILQLKEKHKYKEDSYYIERVREPCTLLVGSKSKRPQSGGRRRTIKRLF